VFDVSGTLTTWLSDVGAVRIGLALGLVTSVAVLMVLVRTKPRDPAGR
jgi:hypothetical protein